MQDSNARHVSPEMLRRDLVTPKRWLSKAHGIAKALRSEVPMQMGPCQASIRRLVGQSATCLHGASSRDCCPLVRPAQLAAPLSARPGHLAAQQGLAQLISKPAHQHA